MFHSYLKLSKGKFPTNGSVLPVKSQCLPHFVSLHHANKYPKSVHCLKNEFKVGADYGSLDEVNT